jgi:hypothetical protein
MIKLETKINGNGDIVNWFRSSGTIRRVRLGTLGMDSQVMMLLGDFAIRTVVERTQGRHRA